MLTARSVLLGVSMTAVPMLLGTMADTYASGVGKPAALMERLPVVAEHRYNMDTRIRLLLVWIRKGDVGGARIAWRRHPNGVIGYELLVGSDPDRAPKRVNRWGYILEEVEGSSARLLGVMTQSDETSIEEARANLKQAGNDGRVYKAIRTTVTDGEARGGTLQASIPHVLTFRDVGTLLEALPDSPAKPRVAQLPAEARPGFLVATAELVRRSVDAQQLGRSTRTLTNKPVPFVFNNRMYDLSLRAITYESETRVHGRSFPSVLTSEFHIRNRGTGNTTSFSMVYGTDGPLAGIPLRIVYRPRWWLEVDLYLDDSVRF